jgi:methionyl-tRNA formyltransferase
MRLIFMGTPEFAVPSLERLIRDGHSVAAVFTQPDKPAGRGGKLQSPPVKLVATGHGIPVHQPAKIRNNEQVRDIFESIAPDACVVAAYGKILPEWLLQIPRRGCINVHSSLLPKYRGAAPVNWAIANGESLTGVTIMQMDPGMDTGPIWTQRSIEVSPEETAPELSARLSELGANLLSTTLPLIEQGSISPTPQNDADATYAPMLKREHGKIDWNERAATIANRVRGFQPWPGSYSSYQGVRVIIWRAVALEPASGADRPAQRVPGTIVRLDKSSFAVACGGDSDLRIHELQVEGKRRSSARDFINGMRLEVGTRMGED